MGRGRTCNSLNNNCYNFKVLNLIDGSTKRYIRMLDISLEYGVSRPTIYKKIKEEQISKLTTIKIYREKSDIYKKVLIN
tara:strand:- start:819 stop:1055 length:237 start_codon:yes stop_codon:yes gene_type:complete